MPVITGNKFTTKNAVSIVVVIIPVISESRTRMKTQDSHEIKNLVLRDLEAASEKAECVLFQVAGDCIFLLQGVLFEDAAHHYGCRCSSGVSPSHCCAAVCSRTCSVFAVDCEPPIE